MPSGRPLSRSRVAIRAGLEPSHAMDTNLPTFQLAASDIKDPAANAARADRANGQLFVPRLAFHVEQHLTGLRHLLTLRPRPSHGASRVLGAESAGSFLAPSWNHLCDGRLVLYECRTPAWASCNARRHCGCGARVEFAWERGGSPLVRERTHCSQLGEYDIDTPGPEAVASAREDHRYRTAVLRAFRHRQAKGVTPKLAHREDFGCAKKAVDWVTG